MPRLFQHQRLVVRLWRELVRTFMTHAPKVVGPSPSPLLPPQLHPHACQQPHYCKDCYALMVNRHISVRALHVCAWCPPVKASYLCEAGHMQAFARAAAHKSPNWSAGVFSFTALLLQLKCSCKSTAARLLTLKLMLLSSRGV